MLSRAVSAALVIGLLGTVALAEEPCCNVIRPKKVDTKVKGCQISEPGEYRATEGDLIELEYTFPIVPGCIPKKVDREWDKGAIYGSKLGIRNLIVPQLIGVGTYLFYFSAKHEGTGTAIVVIDDVKYEYRFEVAANPKKKDPKEKKPNKS
jgi:hypothetical protein